MFGMQVDLFSLACVWSGMDVREERLDGKFLGVMECNKIF